jgi:hypothetical protein
MKVFIFAALLAFSASASAWTHSLCVHAGPPGSILRDLLLAFLRQTGSRSQPGAVPHGGRRLHGSKPTRPGTLPLNLQTSRQTPILADGSRAIAGTLQNSTVQDEDGFVLCPDREARRIASNALKPIKPSGPAGNL